VNPPGGAMTVNKVVLATHLQQVKRWIIRPLKGLLTYLAAFFHASLWAFFYCIFCMCCQWGWNWCRRLNAKAHKWMPLCFLQHYLGALIAGSAAGTASSLIRVPTEVVKQRLQTGEYTSAVNAVCINSAKLSATW